MSKTAGILHRPDKSLLRVKVPESSDGFGGTFRDAAVALLARYSVASRKAEWKLEDSPPTVAEPAIVSSEIVRSAATVLTASMASLIVSELD